MMSLSPGDIVRIECDGGYSAELQGAFGVLQEEEEPHCSGRGGGWWIGLFNGNVNRLPCRFLTKIDEVLEDYEGKSYYVDVNLKVYERRLRKEEEDDESEEEDDESKSILPIGMWDAKSERILSYEEIYMRDRVRLPLAEDDSDIRPMSKFMRWGEWGDIHDRRFGGRENIQGATLRLQDAVERALFDERLRANAELAAVEARMDAVAVENMELKSELKALQQEFNTLSLARTPPVNPFDMLE